MEEEVDVGVEGAVAVPVAALEAVAVGGAVA